MRENIKEDKVKHEMDKIETINIELEHSVAKLLSENECLHKEIEHLKKTYKDQFDSIKKTRALSKEHDDSLIGMFKIDLEPLAPRLSNNREAHIDYLKHIQEQADILQGIVEQAKAKQQLDNALEFAYKHAKRIQELLIYVRDTCPNAFKPSEKMIAVTPMNKIKKVRFSKPLTSSSNIKHVESYKTPNSNTPVLSSTGLKCSTSTCRSQPTNNKKNDRISQKLSSNRKNKVKAQPRKVNKKNRVKEPIYDDMVVHIFLWYLDSGCSKHMTGNHSQLMNFVSKFMGTVRFGNDQVAKILGDTNLYTISLDDMLKTSLICLLSKASKTKSWLWHRRLSHLNFGTLNKLAKDGLARGIPRQNFQKDHLCSAYALGEIKKSSHQPKAEDTNQEKLYLLHMDLCGPMRVESINGKKYILVIVDDYSRFTWTLCDFYENVGISHQTSVARTPQQNGIVERQNRTLVEAAHTMLIFSKAPLQDLGKLNAKADIGIFVGYAPAKKAFRIYNRRTQKRLVPNPIPQQPCNPPNREDWDHLFQPMVDEYFNPPTIVVSPVPVAVAPRVVDTTESPVSTSIDLDAP
ncbi:retrovirus-related pol polyprotein from transposon TNT 1-94 [Tanacetum coccineum]